MEVVSFCNVCHGKEIRQIDAACNLCRCDSCGFVFDSPRPTLAELIAFYSQPTKYDSWLAAERARDILWKRRLRKMLRHRLGGSLLDVGTGIGQFLHHARPYFTHIAGTEVSESAIGIARGKYGLNILKGTVEDLELEPASFDVVTLFHVLEHVPDPTLLIGRCKALLKSGGLLFIAVPNEVLAWTFTARKTGKRLGLGRFQKFSAAIGVPKACTSSEVHLSHFTPDVLARLLESRGFSILEQSLDPYYAESGLRWMAHTAYYALHRVVWSIARRNRYDTI